VVVLHERLVDAGGLLQPAGMKRLGQEAAIITVPDRRDHHHVFNGKPLDVHLSALA
jgi:hypothetical protein